MKQWILQTYGKAASEEEDFSETDEGSLFIDIFTIFTGADFSGFMHIYIIMLFQSMFVAGTLSTSLAMQFQQGFGTFQVIFKSDPAKKSEAPNHEGSFPTRSASGSS